MMKLLFLLITFTNVIAILQNENTKGINARHLESTVVTLIEGFGKKIVELGLDPYSVERTDYETNIIPDSLRVHLSVDEYTFTGVSNIVINKLKFSVQTHELFVEITLPQIFFSVGVRGWAVVGLENKAAEKTLEEFLIAVIVNGRYYKALSHGSIALNEMRLAAKITFVAGADLVLVESVVARASLLSISSNVETNIFGVAIGPLINKFMNRDVPQIMKNNSEAINTVLSAFIKTTLNHTMALM